MPVPTDSRERRALPVVLAAFALLWAVLVATRPSPAASFAEQVGHAPGYAFNVTAAGYWVCGELARGATPGEVIDQVARTGAAGDLWTRDGAARLVEHAPRVLCPDVAR